MRYMTWNKKRPIRMMRIGLSEEEEDQLDLIAST